MEHHEGIVKSVQEGGRAEVVIQPGCAGIPGASGLKVCHAPTGSSRFMIKAVNRVNATHGDMVLVSRSMRTLLRNVTLLLGLPLLGIITGIILHIALREGEISPLLPSYLLPCAGFLLGIVTGVIIYRLKAGGSPFFITAIIEKGAAPEDSSPSQFTPVADHDPCLICHKII